MDVLLTIHDTLLAARGQRFFFLFLCLFFFVMVSNAVETVTSSECQRGENKQARTNGRSNYESL